MKAGNVMYPQALVMLATLVIHVGLAAQETKLPTAQNQVSLFTEPVLAEFALTEEHSLKGIEGSSQPNVTLSPTVVTFYCFNRGLECACNRTAAAVTLTNDGTSTLTIARIGLAASAPIFRKLTPVARHWLQEKAARSPSPGTVSVPTQNSK